MREKTDGSKRLKFVDTTVPGTDVRAVFDSGAIPNVTSGDLYSRLQL